MSLNSLFEPPPPALPAGVDAVLAGHSGARVVLQQADGISVVRKTAGRASDNERLRQQAEKQSAFHAARVPTPKVIRSGLDGDRYFFEMNYVPSISVAASCANGSTAAMSSLRAFVEGWIARLRDQAAGTIGADSVQVKLRAVVAACRETPILHPSMPVIELLSTMLARVRWPPLPEGPCHGDLTLENILVDSKGAIWLIDFDAPELSSYWLDLAKLYQDLSGLWCLRHLAAEDGSTLAYKNAVIAMRRLRAEIDQVVERALPGFHAGLPPLVALHLMRALPYCGDTATIVYILNRVHAVIAG